MTNMPDADPVLVDPDVLDPLSLSNTKPSTVFIHDGNSELTATASALRKRTSADILTPDSFASTTAALASRPNAALLIPPSYGGTSVPDVGTAKTVVDLRPATAHISRLNGKRHIREFSPDETGVSDSLPAFQAAIASMTSGGTIVLAPGANYSISAAISFNGRSRIRIEGNGATITQRAGFVQTTPMMNFSGSSIIEVHDVNLVGIATTASTGAGFSLDGSSFVTLERCSVTSVAGSGISIATDTAAHDFIIADFTSTSCKTHGMSFRTGLSITVDDYVVTGAVTNGVDLGTANTVKLKRGTISTCGGYGMLSTATDVKVDELKVTSCTLGSMSTNGALSRFTGINADGSLSFVGADNIGGQIRCKAFTVSGPRGRYDGVLINTSGATATGVYINSDPTVTVTGLSIAGTETAFSSTSSGSFGSVVGPYQAVESGPWKTWFPNLWKGTAYSDVWVPGGMDHHGDPVYNVKALSGTATKGRNLRGIASPVTAGFVAGSTYTVPFPSVAARQFGAFTLTAATTTSPPAAGVASGTWYVRVGARRTLAGPTAWLPEQSVIVAGAQNTINIGLTNWLIDTIGSDYVEGVSWVRGAAPNTYTFRGDALLTNPPFVSGILRGGTNTVAVYGAGTYNLSMNGATNNIAVTEAGPSAVTAVDESGWEPDASYGVQATTSWASTVYCVAKRRDGFDLKFGATSPAVVGGTVDWVIVR